MKKEDFTPSQDQLKELRNGLLEPFWEVFKLLLEDELKEADDKLHDRKGLWSLEQREQNRQRCNVLEYVLELPELVLEKSKSRKNSEPKPMKGAYD